MEKPDLGQRLREAWRVFYFGGGEEIYRQRGYPSRSDWGEEGVKETALPNHPCLKTHGIRECPQKKLKAGVI